jgi:uncharacterized protein YqgC (DUF456 family)
MAIQKNELSGFATYNYKWTFGALGAGQINDPSSYRDNGGGLPIARSGGLPDKPVTTYIEDTLGINVEFFIDDVEVEYLTTMTPGTGPTSATQIRFNIIEPYSMGLFLQSLVIGSQQGGFSSHLSAPYVLMCEFIGYTDNMTPTVVSKRVLAINLTNLQFKVNEGGCVYEVEAIPYNHQGLLDTVQLPQTDVELQGDTVEQLLGSGEQSLASVLNRNQQELITTAQRLTPDVYKISFPRDISNSTGISQGASLVPSRIQTFQPLLGFGMGQVDPALARAAGINPTAQTDSSYRATIQTNPNANYIGNSPIIQDFNAYGTNPFAEENQVWDPTNRVFTRTNLTIDPARRVFSFSQGTKIQKIIEDVILTSEWATHLQNLEADENNMVDWFRIDTRTTVIDPGEAAFIGRPAMEFEYVVVPYKVHKSHFEPVNQDQDYTPNIQSCIKAYNYSYTGLNEDILSFELEFNNSFFRPFANLTSGTQDAHISSTILNLQQQAGVRTAPAGGRGDGYAELIRRRADASALNAPTQLAPMTYELGTNGGASINTNKKALAQTFSNIVLNSDTENVVVNLKIWGDPYYMADNDAGNYRSAPGSINQNADGTVDWQRSEVDILLNFRSGIDYGANGLLAIDPASMFSGIYKVNVVRSTFSKGMFTQELELLRRPNQTENSIEITQSFVDAFTNGNVNAVNQVISQNSTGGSLVTPYILSLPPELQSFTILGQLGQIQNIFQLPQNAITDAIQNANALISIGSLTASNLVSTLGALGIGGGAIAQIGQIAGQIGQLQTGLNTALQNVGSIITPQLQGAVGQFAQAASLPGVPTTQLAGLQTVGTQFAGLASNTQNAIRQAESQISNAFPNARLPSIPRIRIG